MNEQSPRSNEPAGVSASLAVVLALISFFALAIFGLGAVSVITDTDIIRTPGLGQAPGVIGMLTAVVVFALMLALSLRRQHPSFGATVTIALGTAIAHLIVVWLAVVVSAGSFVIATAVAGDLVRGGPSAVIVCAAAVAAWGGIALRRTRSQRPRWPWERDSEE